MSDFGNKDIHCENAIWAVALIGKALKQIRQRILRQQGSELGRAVLVYAEQEIQKLVGGLEGYEENRSKGSTGDVDNSAMLQRYLEAALGSKTAKS